MRDMTDGGILRQIILFSIPLFIGNLFQLLYNVIDTKVVGSFLGESALAAMGASGIIYDLAVVSLAGLATGFGIVVSQRFGAKDMFGMRKAAAGALLIGVLIAAICSVCFLAMLDPLLLALGTPHEFMPQCNEYAVVVLSLLVVMMIYNTLAAILRAIGDTLRPLIFLMVSLFLNALLDIVFVCYLGLGVSGVAWATVVSQALAAFACAIYIVRFVPALHIKRTAFVINKDLAADLLGQGVSMSLMYAFVASGTLILQGAINCLGTDIIAAHTISRKIHNIAILPFTTVGVATATFVGQNYGAGRYDRIVKEIKCAIGINWCWCVVVVIAVWLIGPCIVELVSSATSEEVIGNAVWYVRVNFPFYFYMCIWLVLRNAMQGFGDKKPPLVTSLMEMGGKIAFALFLTGQAGEQVGYLGIIISEPIIWMVCTTVIIAWFARDISKVKRNLANANAGEQA